MGSINHKGCGGEIVSNEMVVISYEIVSDGAGGWEYGGNRVDEFPFEGPLDYLFTCRKCGWNTEHYNAIINGEEMSDKHEGKL
jgi:hypothetical protein